jgi:hypothetical protein
LRSLNRSSGGIIGGVVRRIVFVGILCYVTLDLAAPGIPGAFVFEPADSVEGAQTSRWRAPGDGLPLPALLSEIPTSTAPVTDRQAWRPAIAVHRPVIVGAIGRLPRATLASPAPPEDPL